MPSEDYVREKLCAVECLATSARPLHDRLAAAFGNLNLLRPAYFVDEESRVRFTAIMERGMALEHAGGVASLHTTISTMSDAEAQALAKRIVELDDHYRPLWYFVGKSITDPID